MRKSLLVLLAGVGIFGAAVPFGTSIDAHPRQTGAGIPRYLPDGRLAVPTDYREWVFLSSSIDMSYSDRPVHQFDNVFVPHAAYRAFLKTGVWPDKTVLILENRGAASKGSITKSGQFQSGGATSLEAHVKDIKRFKGGWGFFAFDRGKPGDMLPYSANCYSCHQMHGAADTTFVQFYPTLLPTARQRGTLNPAYVAAEAR